MIRARVADVGAAGRALQGAAAVVIVARLPQAGTAPRLVTPELSCLEVKPGDA